MQTHATTLLMQTLRRHVIETRAAYYRGHVQYEDMAAAARRYLEMQATLERQGGRKARPVTSGAIAHLLRAL